MSTLLPDWPITNTEHGMLVAFGAFLTEHGLLDQLRQVPIAQKTRKWTPQAKLIEFAAGIMSGIEHLQDINHGPHPLAPDTVVARAWGLEGFAHYSNVSRTLHACDDRTVAAVEQAIMAFSQPFIDQAVHALARRGQPIILDCDLTGQPVSATSTTYPQATFGWMDNQVQLGYQLARVSLTPATGERIWLAGFHHPGDTLSFGCLKELILAAEKQMRVRPTRRPELVDRRIAAHQAAIARLRGLADGQQAKLDRLRATHTTLLGQCCHAQQAENWPIPAGKLARLRTQQAAWQARLPRLVTQIAEAESVLSGHRARLSAHEGELAELAAWRAQLIADNQANPNAPHFIARMDAGFASGENLAWLLEMGYRLDTKAANGQITNALLARLPAEAKWIQVGNNAEMTLVGEHYQHGCPYPLTVALERFKVGQNFKHATLVRYGPVPKLAAWFKHYNARQTIEAGNKEMKSVFHVQHLMSHSLAGIQLQVLFTGLAANVLRWCRPWLMNCVAQPTSRLTQALKSPKAVVRIAANAPALVQQTDAGLSVCFGPRSGLPGAALILRHLPAVQLPLGFHRPYNFASDSTKRSLVAQNLR